MAASMFSSFRRFRVCTPRHRFWMTTAARAFIRHTRSRSCSALRVWRPRHMLCIISDTLLMIFAFSFCSRSTMEASCLSWSCIRLRNFRNTVWIFRALQCRRSSSACTRRPR